MEPETIPTWWYQPNFRSFREYYDQTTKTVLFIGSGVSISAGLPNWHDLLLKLVANYDSSRSPDEKPLIGEIERMISHSSHVEASDYSYEDAGTILEQAYKHRGADKWKSALRSILADDKIQPSELHKAIAVMKWSKVITTNYDALLDEEVIKELGKNNVLITDPRPPGLENTQPTDKPCIVKIHGDIAKIEEFEPVLSRKSFEDLYVGEYSRIKAIMTSLLTSAGVVLFIGYSHNDKYARKLYQEAMTHGAPGHAFAIVPREGRPREFSERISRLNDELGIKFITYSPEGNHAELLEFIHYLDKHKSNSAALERDEHYQRLELRRKPTVVLLHCGGTIGAESPGVDPHGPLKVIIKHSRFDKGLEQFSNKVLRWYRRAYTVAEEADVDLLWEILPVENQMFSENASPESWDALRIALEEIVYKYFHAPADLYTDGALDSKTKLGLIYEREDAQHRLIHGKEKPLPEREFIRHFTHRYVMGIIVLYGTDTLTFTAASLAFGLEHLPCSIIVTGANQPPEDEDMIAGRTPEQAESDAWTNLQLALLFLQSYGHRLTEVFIAFGGTIHNAINLRKRTTDIIPTDRGRTQQYSEPFAFRNLSLRGQYMFKLVDGIFCDNFYTHFGQQGVSRYADLFKEGPIAIRHFREQPFDLEPSQRMIPHQFSKAVAYVEITPAFPPMDVAYLVKNKIRAVLAEGYASGTYPSIAGHHFTRLLKDAYEWGVPIVLISRYGILAALKEYEVSEDVESRSPILRLYEVVTETALPLLSVALQQTHDRWDAPAGKTLITHRLDELKKTINSLLRHRNILTLELEHTTNKHKMMSVRNRLAPANGRHDGRWESPFQAHDRFPSQEIEAALKNADEKIDRHHAGFTVLTRADLFSMLDEFTRLFEKVGAGPDGLEQVCNIGFEIGGPLWDSYEDKRQYEEGADDASALHFFEIEEEGPRNRRLQWANENTKDVCVLIDSIGIGKVFQVPEVKVGKRPRSISAFVKFQSVEGDEVLHDYYVSTFSDAETRFIHDLENGWRTADLATYRDTLTANYMSVLRNNWSTATSTADWFFIGLFKGVFCAAARFLLIDEDAVRTKDPKLRKALRKRVKTTIDGAHSVLQVTYEYSTPR